METVYSQEREDSTVTLQMVSFQVGVEEYAVDISSVQEIIHIQDLTTVPKTPDFLKGVINLRGKIIPIVDLTTRLSLSPKQPTKESRIVVVEDSGKTVGLIVDAMREVIRIPSCSIRTPPTETEQDGSSLYIRGVAKMDNRLLVILDLEHLLGEDVLKELPQP